MGETARLLAELELRDNFSKGIHSATTSLKGLESSLGRMGRGVGQVAGGIDRLATRAAVAAVGGLTAVVTTAASMEEAFTGIRKTVDETAAISFEQLREQLRGMSSDTGTAFEELSRIGEIGGALGIGIESLDEFIDVVNRLSVSTDLTADAAATALGQLGTILHLEGEELRTFSDSLVALGNAGASTEPQIVDIAARFAAAGNAAGLSVDEILALASATASMGIEAEAGGTALSRVFNNVSTNIGTSSAKAQAFADALGLSATEFRDAWEQDALGTLQDFLAQLGELDQFEQASLLKRVGITNVRDVATIRLMAQNFGFLGEQLRVAEESQGALNEESDKFFGTSAASFRKLQQNVRLVGESIGNELLPLTNELITEFIDFLQLPTTQTGIKDFAKDLAKGIRDLVTELKGTDFSGLIGGLRIAADVAKGAFDAFRKLPEPIQQLAIAALVANKVSGGAIGQIAKGLANIGGGLLTGGGLLGRGSSAANPVWVQSVTGIGGDGPGGWFGGIGRALLTAAGFVTGAGALVVADQATRPIVEENNPFDPDNRLGDIFTEIREGFPDAVTAIHGTTDAIESWTPLGQFDPSNPGGTQTTKPITGAPKASPELPDTAFDPGGGVVNLPDTALSLSINVSEIAKLPPIGNRQLQATQVLAQRVNENRAAIGRGFSELGGVIRSRKNTLTVINKVEVGVSISDLQRRLISSRVLTGTISEI